VAAARSDRGALDVAAQLAVVGTLGENGGGYPDDAEAERGPERGPEQPVEQPDPGNDERAPQPEADALEAAGEDRTGDDRSDQAEGGRVGGGGAFGQDQRSDARSEHGAGGESAEGENADYEAPPKPE
jgi:hypothetical protein